MLKTILISDIRLKNNNKNVKNWLENPGAVFRALLYVIYDLLGLHKMQNQLNICFHFCACLLSSSAMGISIIKYCCIEKYTCSQYFLIAAFFKKNLTPLLWINILEIWLSNICHMTNFLCKNGIIKLSLTKYSETRNIQNISTLQSPCHGCSQ